MKLVNRFSFLLLYNQRYAIERARLVARNFLHAKKSFCIPSSRQQQHPYSHRMWKVCLVLIGISLFAGGRTIHLLRQRETIYSNSKNWADVASYWGRIIEREGDQLPDFVMGDAKFGITTLSRAHNAGNIGGEFLSNSDRYTKRRTYAIRVGYDGTKFHGYQRQKQTCSQQTELRTVEGDLSKILGRHTYAAGRTDKDVSAVGQIVSFSTNDLTTTPQEYLQQIHESDACKAKHLRAYECFRVPRSFNSRSSAIWRRYLYLYPLGEGVFPGGIDVDIGFVNKILDTVCGRELPYNALSSGENNNQGCGMKDMCTMYRARGILIDLGNGHPFSTDRGLSSTQTPVICIELVANRFLRRMVRILSATVLREASLPPEMRNDNALLDICASGDRNRAAPALPGEGLCLAGVGFDETELALFKEMKKANRDAFLRERKESKLFERG